MADKENQQEQILEQTKSLYSKVAGNPDIANGVNQALNGATELGKTAVKGSVELTKATGSVLQAPGAVVEGIGDVAGNVAKAPGAVVQGTSNALGTIASAPGAAVQGAGDLVGKGINATGQALGTGVESLLGKGAGDLVKGTFEVTGGLVKGATGIVGGVMKVPGEIVKGVGHFAGEVLKVPGNLLQGATKAVGGILKAPGEILKGLAGGVENLLFKTKDNTPTLNGATINNPKMSTKEAIKSLESADLKPQDFGLSGVFGGTSKVFIYGNELNKMDKFAENMGKLANGEKGQEKPFSSILTKPKSERAEAVKEATVQLRSDLHKIKDRLDKNPGSFTKEQQAELKIVMDGIEKQGGIDKYMDKNFNLPENYQNKEKANDLVKDSKESSDKGRESLKKQLDNSKEQSSEKTKESKEKFGVDDKDSKEQTPQEKADKMMEDAKKSTEKGQSGMKKQIESIKKDTADKTKSLKDKQTPGAENKDVKPVISGTQAPSIKAPTKSVNNIGR